MDNIQYLKLINLKNFLATSMFESMWNSMTSSMQLAEECAKQDGVNTSNSLEAYEGIKLFAQTIDSGKI